MAREGTGTLADAKPNRSYQWIVLALTFVAQTSNAITALAVAPLATIFQPELGLTKAEVGFFSSAAFAGSLSVLLVTGSLTDRFGVRKMMTVGQLVSGGFVLAMSAVVSFPQAVLVMLSAGLGRGATAPGITKAVIDQQPYLQGFYTVVELAMMKFGKFAAFDVDTGRGIVNDKNIDEVIGLAKKRIR